MSKGDVRLINKVLQFGPFRLDPANQLLLREGTPVPLAPKAFDTLTYLVQEGARLVTRDELMKAIWPDSFVEDANLTVNISLLRKALGEMENGRPYIETVPRKGYRFNASVVAAEADASERPRYVPAIVEPLDVKASKVSGNQAEPSAAPLEHADSRGKVSTEAVAREPVFSEIIPFLNLQPDEAAEPGPVPDTQNQGRQEARATGSAVPAAKGDIFKGWVPNVRNEARQASGASDIAAIPPVFFPRWLLAALGVLIGFALMAAWLRWRRPQPALEFVQRRLTSFSPEMAVTAAAISTGSKFVAYANPSGLFVQVVSTGDTHSLVLPAPHFQVSGISWFPDSAQLLVGGSSPGDANPSLWIVPVIGTSRPTELGPYPPGVVSPDGSEIAWASNRNATPQIQLMNSSGGAVQTLTSGASNEIFGRVSWSSDGLRLFFTRYAWNAQLRGNSGSIDFYDLRSGKVATVLASDDLGDDAISLRDGRVLYSKILGANPSAYGGELLAVRTDPQTGAATRAPSLIAKWNAPIADLTVNASGTRLAVRDFLVQHNAYIGELAHGRIKLVDVHRFSFGVGREDFPRAWTADSKAVFLDSNRSGHWEIFKQALDSDSDEPFINGPDDQFSPRLSPDGAWLLYLDRPEDWREPQPVSLMRVPISGGLPQLVLKAPGISEWGLRFECPRRPAMPCLLAQRNGARIAFRTFDPAKGIRAGSVEVARTDYVPHFRFGWSLAPDGLGIAWVKMDPTDNQVHLLLARSASGLEFGSRERNVTIPGGAYLRSIIWSPDGEGWFITRQFPASWTLLYVGLQGRTSTLIRVSIPYPSDVLPSPDGHQLAFSEQSFASNVWLLEHF